MSIRRSLVICTMVFVASRSVANAGLCSQDIDHLQAQFDAKLEANAAAGPFARESTAATIKSATNAELNRSRGGETRCDIA